MNLIIKMNKKNKENSEIIQLNIGGEIFYTTIQTISRESSLLYAFILGEIEVSKDKDGRIFIDRDPKYFRWILNYLRDGSLLTLPEPINCTLELLQEARVYRITGLINFIEFNLRNSNQFKSI